MRILVCLKQIYDLRLPLQVNGLQAAPESGPPVYEISPASRASLEWGIRFKKQSSCDMTAVSAGGDEVETALRSSLALGADRAVQLSSAESAPVDAVVKEVLAREINLVLCGDGSFGLFLAEALDWPAITRVEHLEVCKTHEIRASRLLERGDRQEAACSLPAVVTFHPSGLTPTYLSRLRLQQSASLPIERVDCSQIASSPVQGLMPVEMGPPKARPRRMAAPAAGMSASQRMSFLMGGSQARGAAKTDSLVEGDAEQVAEKIFQFLRERGFL